MDTHNNFQMPSKQYLTETSEHQLESWHTAQAALLPAVSQASPRATSVGSASAACLDGHGSLKYIGDQIQQNSSTLGFTIESRCCSLWQAYMTHVTWAHHWSTAVPVCVGRYPATLNMNQMCFRETLFWISGITNLLFLKYMQGLEGVGTQCVEAVSMRKSFSSPHTGTSMSLCLLSIS